MNREDRLVLVADRADLVRTVGYAFYLAAVVSAISALIGASHTTGPESHAVGWAWFVGGASAALVFYAAGAGFRLLGEVAKTWAFDQD